MKRAIKLSQAFGKTPPSVYKKVEYTFGLSAAESVSLGHQTSFDAEGEKTVVAARIRLSLVVALAAALLCVTALMLLPPKDVKKNGTVTGKDVLGDVRVTIAQNMMDEKEVRATAYFDLAVKGQLHYFWYDGKTLPERFPAVTAAEGEQIYYVYCVLSWPEGDERPQSDLASAKEEGNGRLAVMMSGAWTTAAQEVCCHITVVRAAPDGSYAPEDVYQTELPV